jgi:FtsH-binding integral membrane protein
MSKAIAFVLSWGVAFLLAGIAAASATKVFTPDGVPALGVTITCLLVALMLVGAFSKKGSGGGGKKFRIRIPLLSKKVKS